MIYAAFVPIILLFWLFTLPPDEAEGGSKGDNGGCDMGEEGWEAEGCGGDEEEGRSKVRERNVEKNKPKRVCDQSLRCRNNRWRRQRLEYPYQGVCTSHDQLPRYNKK